MLDNFQLYKRVALVTGGAGLLGKEHALALLELGATVYLGDIDNASLHTVVNELAHLYPGMVFPVMFDVTNEDSILTAQEMMSAAGHIPQIVINNAALNPRANELMNRDIVKYPSRIEEMPLLTWEKEINVGLTGAFLVSRIFGQRMVDKGLGGVIINVASDLSVIAPDQRLYKTDVSDEYAQPVKPVTYSVIKAGLIGLTRYLSTYWADRGIRCNAISPGGVYDGQTDEFVKRLVSRIPMGRMAKKDEYRSTMQYLCSDASAYLTGQNIVIDGGRSVW